MQTRNFLFLTFALFGGLVLLTACAPQQLKTKKGILKTPTVKLQVSGNTVRIKRAASSKCNNSKDPICIVVPYLDRALITFELTPKAGWRFSEFKICVGTTKDDQVCELNEYQRAEFEASVAGGTRYLNPNQFGAIDLEPLSPNLNDAFTKFQVLDRNWVKRDYFYSIEVCPTGSNETGCIWTDPPIENEGGGGHRNF